MGSVADQMVHESCEVRNLLQAFMRTPPQRKGAALFVVHTWVSDTPRHIVVGGKDYREGTGAFTLPMKDTTGQHSSGHAIISHNNRALVALSTGQIASIG